MKGLVKNTELRYSIEEINCLYTYEQNYNQLYTAYTTFKDGDITQSR